MSAADQAKGPYRMHDVEASVVDRATSLTVAECRTPEFAEAIIDALNNRKAAQPLAAALRKLADRVDIVNRGVAEGVELIGLVAEARDALRGWETP